MTPRPLTLLLAALGGQGGGVLTNWLVETARLAGFPAQATSIPGVAQRTGATTYYFEMFPDPHPPADPIFCLFPSAGDVDVVAALEVTEAGRALQDGFVTSCTTVITSTGRIYSVAEKSIAGEGRMEAAPILDALERVAKRVMRADPPLNGQANAFLFGAIIASGVLPLSESDARKAIEHGGLAVAANLAGLAAGLKAARPPQSFDSVQGKSPITNFHLPVANSAPPPGFDQELSALPDAMRPLIGHALSQLVDYQDIRYARQYLARLAPILQAELPGEDYRLSCEVARRLAAWMSREDIPRVAQLKTRPGRLARIREEVGAREGEPVEVVDYLSPSWEEVSGVLPAPLFGLLDKALGEKRKIFDTHLAWRTSTPWGFAALKFLARLRWLRPCTLAFAREQAAIESWLAAVRRAAEVDYALACQTAELAVWARGYGEVRVRGLACLEKVFTNWDVKVSQNPDAVRAEVQAALRAARQDPDGVCR